MNKEIKYGLLNTGENMRQFQYEKRGNLNKEKIWDNLNKG